MLRSDTGRRACLTAWPQEPDNEEEEGFMAAQSRADAVWEGDLAKG